MSGAEQYEQEVVTVRENSEIIEKCLDRNRCNLNSFSLSNSPVLEGRVEQELQAPDPHMRAAHMCDSTQPTAA